MGKTKLSAADIVTRKIAGKDVEPDKKSFMLPYLGAAAGGGIQKVAVSDTSKALSLLGMDPSAVTRTAGRTHRLTTQPRYADALMKAKNLPMLATALSSGALMLGDDEMQDKVLQAASVGLPASYLPRLIEEVDAAGRGAAMFSRGGKSFLKKFTRSGKGIPTTLAMAMSAGMIPYLLRKSKMLEEEPRKTAKANPEVLSGKEDAADAVQKLIDGNKKEADITLDIDIGDTILGGRFKNKKIVVEEFGTSDIGQPTVNDRQLLSYRIAKKMPEKKGKTKGKDKKPAEDKKKNMFKDKKSAADIITKLLT